MNKCIDTPIQEMLPDLLHGSLDEQARRLVETHLAGCESCREDLDVIGMVKSAAVFAPRIDVEQVVRQIPPYRAIVPGARTPARAKMVQWLVAAGLTLAVAGGGSLVISKQPRPQPTVATIAATQTHGLALASNLDDLSDGSLKQLMNDMDQFDALPTAEPEPVISVDNSDSL